MPAEPQRNSPRRRRLRKQGLLDDAGELTHLGEAIAEERAGGHLDDDVDEREPEPYPDSQLY